MELRSRSQGAQPQQQPLPAGGGALPQPPTVPAEEILLGVTGFSPMSPPPGHGRGDCGIPLTFAGSEEQHGAFAPGWGPSVPVLPASPQHWLSLSPWPCLHPPVYPILLSPSSARSCSSLGGRLGGPQGHGPLSGLLSSHLPPPGPDQACRYLLATGRDASGVGGETEARSRQERGRAGGAASGAQSRLHA